MAEKEEEEEEEEGQAKREKTTMAYVYSQIIDCCIR